MMWIWILLVAFMAWVLFVDLVWNNETKVEKSEPIDLAKTFEDGWN